MATSTFLGAGTDRKILASGNKDSAVNRIQSIYENRGVKPVGDLASMAASVMSGQKSFNDIRSAVEKMQNVPAPQAAQFPRTGAELTSEQVRMLSERRRAADSSFEEALARAQAQKNTAEDNAREAARRVGTSFRDENRTGMSSFASRGVARNPRQAGRFLRSQRDSEAEARFDVENQLNEQRRALDMFVEDARRSRDDQLLTLENDKANMQANLGLLFPAGNGAF
jgi:hypothetical protein